MRILKFIGIYLSVLLGVFAIVFIPNWKDFITVFDNQDALSEGTEWIEKTYSIAGLTEFINAHPELVSVYAKNVTTSEEILSIQSDKKRSLSSLGLLPIAIEYFRQVDKSFIPENQKIDLAILSDLALPHYYFSNHSESLKWLKSQSTTGMVNADLVLQAGFMFNDYAIHDYFLNLVTPDSLEQLSRRFDLTIDRILPLTALGLYLHPEVRHKLFSEIINSPLDYSEAENLYSTWTTDADFRERINAIFTKSGYGLSFLEEKQSYNIFPKTTPKSLSQLIELAIYGNLLTKESSERLVSVLRWPMNDATVNRQFKLYGGAFESKIGLLSGADFGTVDGKNQIVQVVIFDQIPVAMWFHMSSNYMNLDYQRRLYYDSKLQQISLNGGKL